MADQPTEKTVIRGELRVYDDDGMNFTPFEAPVGKQLTLALDQAQRSKIASGNHVAVQVMEVVTKKAESDN